MTRRILIGSLMVGTACVSVLLASPPTYTPAVAVPVYAAIHGANQPAADATDLIAALKENTAAVKELTAALRSIETGPAPAPPPVADGLAVAKSACLGCHSPTTAEAKGFGFRLFADDNGAALAPLNNRDRLRAANRISDGSMPPPKVSKITDAERKALADYFKGK